MSDKEKKQITILIPNEKPWENPDEMKKKLMLEANKRARILNLKFSEITQDEIYPETVNESIRKTDNRNRKRYNPDGTLKMNSDWYIKRFGINGWYKLDETE